MDRAEYLAQKRNCGIYRTLLWQYFFSKTDASLTSGSESEQDEVDEFNDSNYITLENIHSL